MTLGDARGRRVVGVLVYSKCLLYWTPMVHSEAEGVRDIVVSKALALRRPKQFGTAEGDYDVGP